MSGKKYEKILEPGRIGSLKTKNRIIKTGAGLLMLHETDTKISDEFKALYEGIARGGVGLLVVESPIIDYPRGARWRKRYRFDNDKYIKGMKELVDLIHKYECPTFMAMNHDGPWQLHLIQEPNPLYDGPPIAASPVFVKNEHDNHNEKPRALTIAEIDEIIEKFGKAAVRAKKAGFDGVDINAGSSHLFHNFLSPFWNRRKDKFGGTPENRARLITSVIREIKDKVGSDFPVSVIINGVEVGQTAGIDDSQCLTPELSRIYAKLIEQAGADAIQIRNHWIGYHVGGFLPDQLFYPEPPIPLKSFPKEYYTGLQGAGANIMMAAGVKKNVSIPVTVVGRLDPDLGEKILERGMADFIGMTRRLHADPNLPNKLASGNAEDIAPCMGCAYCLGSRGKCRVNGFMGMTINQPGKADRKKKVMVVGGGPAGMEAARVSALRGHDVYLFEKAGRLGGLLPIAAVVKGFHPENLPLLVKYFKRQLNKLNVKVKLGKKVDISTVKKIKPDVLVIAAGGLLTLPKIKGIESPIVVSGPKLHKMLKFFVRIFGERLLRFFTKFYIPFTMSKNVVVIGGALQGCEMAEFLVKRGRNVTIVDKIKAGSFGDGMTNIMKEHLFMWFEKKGVGIVGDVREFVEITKNGLTIIDKDGKTRTIEAGTIIPAMPLEQNTEILKDFDGKASDIFAIGDCKEPALIADAISKGLETAMKI